MSAHTHHPTTPLTQPTRHPRWTSSLRLLGWLCLSCYASIAQAEQPVLPGHLVQTPVQLKPFRCQHKLAYAERQHRVDNLELDLEAIKEHRKLLQKTMLDWQTQRHQQSVSSAQQHKLLLRLQRLKTELGRTRRQEQKYDQRLQEMQLCKYRITLQKLLRRKSLSPRERRFAQTIQKLQAHFQIGKQTDLSTLKRRYLHTFREIYNHFWQQSRLTHNACGVLNQTYRSWASFYEADNLKSRAIPAKSPKIPFYNSNGHNDSYRVWSWEAQKGRIPKSGLTLLHLDSHPDMGTYKDRSPGHWTDRILSLLQLNQALSHRRSADFLRYLRQKLSASKDKAINLARKQALLEYIQQTPISQLRRELHSQIPRRVNNIAHPVTAATYAGITNKLVLCMPPWSHRFEMSEIDPKTHRSKAITLHLVRELKNEQVYFGVPQTMAKHPFVDGAEMPSFFLFDLAKGRHHQFPHRIPFHVTSCVNEDLSQLDDNNRDELPAFKSYFSPKREGKNGFILGFDLDVFATNGDEYDNYVVPTSYGREFSLKPTKQSIAKARKLNTAPHKHARAHKGPRARQSTRKKHRVPRVPTHINAKEYFLVKRRIKEVFDRLKVAKQQGYQPKVITIADSTSLTRAFRDGLHRAAVGGGDYVPACLAFLINYHVRTQLAQLYPGQISPGIEASATSHPTSARTHPTPPR